MSGEKYADRAVAALLAYVEAGLPTALRAVETAQSLTTNTITNPVDYVPARVPADTRSPLVEIWAKSGGRLPEDECGRNNIFGYDCTIRLACNSDANTETGPKRIRQYMTALLDLIDADNTLSAATRIVHTIDTVQNFEAEQLDASMRYALELGVDVIVFEG